MAIINGGIYRTAIPKAPGSYREERARERYIYIYIYRYTYTHTYIETEIPAKL